MYSRLPTAWDYIVVLSRESSKTSWLGSRFPKWTNMADEPLIDVTDADVEVPLSELVRQGRGRRRVSIKNMGRHKDIFYALECTILCIWEDYPRLRDEDVISAFDELLHDFDGHAEGTTAGELERGVKGVLVSRKRQGLKSYTLDEVLLCVSLLREIADMHNSPSGVGYLQWIKTFFEGGLPRTKREIRDYILKYES